MSKENKGRRKKSLSTSKSKVKMIKSTKLKVKKPQDTKPKVKKPKVKKTKVKKPKDQSNINPELQTNNIKQTEKKEIEQNNEESVLSTKLQEPEKEGWDQLAKQAEERSKKIAEQGRNLGSNPLSRALVVAKLSQSKVNEAGTMVEKKANAMGVNKQLSDMKSVAQAAGMYKPKKTTETSGPINVSNLNNKL